MPTYIYVDTNKQIMPLKMAKGAGTDVYLTCS